MTASRFDNQSLDQMREALEAARAEIVAIEKALAARLEAACPVQVDGIYRVKPPPDVDATWFRYGLTGRIVQVTRISAHRCGIGDDEPVELRVSVRTKLVGKRATPTGDGFGRKYYWIDPARLEPVDTAKTPAPRPANRGSAR